MSSRRRLQRFTDSGNQRQFQPKNFTELKEPINNHTLFPVHSFLEGEKCPNELNMKCTLQQLLAYTPAFLKVEGKVVQAFLQWQNKEYI